MTLRAKRCLFTKLMAELIVWINAEKSNIEVAFGEGYVAITDARDGDYDGPHIKRGGHYTGLAVDLLLYIQAVWIHEGSHPLWKVLGEKWESMHPLCRWGGRFGDPNHFSLEHDGVK